MRYLVQGPRGFIRNLLPRLLPAGASVVESDERAGTAIVESEAELPSRIGPASVAPDNREVL